MPSKKTDMNTVEEHITHPSQLSPKAKPERHVQPFDFKNNISWRIFRILSEFIDGFEFISELKHPVTIFGSARTGENEKEYKQARLLAKKLGKAGYTIVTGGGPGIMEAANRGAVEVKAESIGLNIQLPYEQRMNKWVQRGIGFYYFFSRKTMMSTSSRAYVFFPGGFGTLDEFFTIATLIQNGKIDKRPLILFGCEYWCDLDAFIRKRMLQDGAISKKDAQLYTITDDMDEVLRLVKKAKGRQFTFM
ncbi:MAG: TIGR00730 family Rossman fold protein [Candidatus Nomurabacteria bacterium]|nr:MAG: TIGR00730 family Rossman fold protein [Candidatus Nomurabacteria bacterium]